MTESKLDVGRVSGSVTRPTELPVEWVKTSIKDICELNPKVKLKDDLDVAFMPMSAVPKEFHGKPEYDIKKWNEVKKGYTQFKDGDALFAKITPCFENGKACVIEQFPNGWGAGSTEFYVLRPINQCIHPKLLLALVKTQDFLTTGAVNMTGSVGHKRVAKEFVENYSLPLPPLAEQQQIADKLDKLLVQVDTLKTRLDSIPKILKRFRQSVLAAAVSGKLTDDCRQFKGVPLTNFTKIDSIVESSFYGPRFSKSNYTDELTGVPTIRTTDMEAGEITVTKETPRVAVPEEKLEKFRIKKNDLLITRTGSIGVMALFTGEYTAIPSAYLIRFRFKKDVNTKYIFFALTSPDGQQKMGLSMTSITQPNINAKSIRAIEIRLPTLDEQTEIVTQVEKLFTYADQIEQRVKDAQAKVDNLTQSILAKAFRGELTADWRAQNPDLISGENSAEALLAKIKAERKKMAPTKKKTRKVKS